MPEDFLKCQRDGGRIRTKLLPGGKFIRICFDKNGKSLCFLYSGLCIQDGCDERYKQCPKTSSCNLILGNNFKLPFESK